MMNSIRFNFIKRAFIIPAVITLLLLGIITAVFRYAPMNIANTSTEVKAGNTPQYNINEYSSFSELEKGDYVGNIKCSDISFESPIVFDDNTTSCVTLSKISKEPWKNGGIILIGNNVKTQFKPLHNAEIGDEFTVEFLGNESCTYKLKEINRINSEKNIKSYQKDNRLILCMRYNDFINLGGTYLYAVYVAEREVIQ